MSYLFRFPHRLQDGIYKNAKGNTECVEFVRSVTAAPHSSEWKKGVRIKDVTPNDIPFGTAIATFDESGKYPTDDKGRHAAIYISHSKDSILVYDQFNKKGKVTKRAIYFGRPSASYRSNNGEVYFVIE